MYSKKSTFYFDKVNEILDKEKKEIVLIEKILQILKEVAEQGLAGTENVTREMAGIAIYTSKKLFERLSYPLSKK